MPAPGTRVLLRPYHGLWIEPLTSDEPAISPVGDRDWKCHGKCVAIEPDRARASTGVLEVVGGEAGVPVTGRVVSTGPQAWPVVGSRVVFSSFHPRTARSGLDTVEDGVVIVEDRQIFATLGPSLYRGGQVRFYGAGTDWRKSVLMFDSGGRWRAIRPWVEIEVDWRQGLVAMPEVLAARHRMIAMTVGDGLAQGSRVLVDPNPMDAISFELGDVGRERRLVHESAIWAVLE